MVRDSDEIFSYKATAFFHTSSFSNLNIPVSVSPLWLCLKSLSLSFLPAPIARVAEIAGDRALRHFRNHRQAALVLRGDDAARELIDDCFSNPLTAQLLARVCLIDHEIEEFANLAIGKTQPR